MLPLDTVLTFFVTALMLALAPGPDIIFVLTQSALYGMRAGVATTLGLISGLCFHTTIVAVGVAGIFMTSPLAFTLLTVVGAAYLLYLAWLSFRAGASMAHLQESRFLGYWGLYRRGVIMNITNPKVTLFFLRAGTRQRGPAGHGTGPALHAGGLPRLHGRLGPGRPPGPLVQQLAARPDAHAPRGRSGLRGPGRDADLFLRGLSRAKACDAAPSGLDTGLSAE